MDRLTFVRAAVVAVGLSALGMTAAAAQDKPFEPQVGQAGKDVVWVPSPDALVEKMLDMAKLTPADFLIDLGGLARRRCLIALSGVVAVVAGRTGRGEQADDAGAEHRTVENPSH